MVLPDKSASPAERAHVLNQGDNDTRCTFISVFQLTLPADGIGAGAGKGTSARPAACSHLILHYLTVYTEGGCPYLSLLPLPCPPPLPLACAVIEASHCGGPKAHLSNNLADSAKSPGRTIRYNQSCGVSIAAR